MCGSTRSWRRRRWTPSPLPASRRRIRKAEPGTASAPPPTRPSSPALHAHFKAGLRECARRDVVTSHAAFGYLTRRYRLHQVPVLGIAAPESEPEPRRLARLVRFVRKAERAAHFLRDPGEPEARRDPGAGGRCEDARAQPEEAAPGRGGGGQGLSRPHAREPRAISGRRSSACEAPAALPLLLLAVAGAVGGGANAEITVVGCLLAAEAWTRLR